VDANPGFFSTDLICTNKSGEQLADVDLSVTAYFERGTSTGEGHYRKWLPDQSKTVSVSSAGGDTAFQRAAKQLGMPIGRESGYTLHALRRLFETHCINSGVPQRAGRPLDGASERQVDGCHLLLAV
jgi:hypothetical protein